MVRTEETYKSFQIYHPVVETEHLVQFLKRADVIGQFVFGTRGGVTMPVPEEEKEMWRDLETDEIEAAYVQTRSYGISKHKVYDSEKLKVTVFDRRSPLADSRQLSRLALNFTPAEQVPVAKIQRSKRSAQPSNARQRVAQWEQEIRQAGLRHDFPDTSSISLVMNALSILPNPGYEGKGREISLIPDAATPENLFLVDEAIVSHSAVADLSRQSAYPTGRQQIEASFVRVPHEASDTQVGDFVGQVAKLLPIRLELSQLLATR